MTFSFPFFHQLSAFLLIGHFSATAGVLNFHGYVLSLYCSSQMPHPLCCTICDLFVYVLSITGCRELFLLFHYYMTCTYTLSVLVPVSMADKKKKEKEKRVSGTWEMAGQITLHLHSNWAFDKASATGSLISRLAVDPWPAFTFPLFTAMILRRSFKLEIITH